MCMYVFKQVQVTVFGSERHTTHLESFDAESRFQTSAHKQNSPKPSRNQRNHKSHPRMSPARSPASLILPRLPGHVRSRVVHRELRRAILGFLAGEVFGKDRPSAFWWTSKAAWLQKPTNTDFLRRNMGRTPSFVDFQSKPCRKATRKHSDWLLYVLCKNRLLTRPQEVNKSLGLRLLGAFFSNTPSSFKKKNSLWLGCQA